MSSEKAPTLLGFLAGLALSLAPVTTTGCGKNLAEIFFHPSVESRVADSMGVATPSPLALSSPTQFNFAVFGDVQIRADGYTLLPRFKTDVAPNGISFFVVLGDLTEDGTTAEFAQVKTALDAVGIPYFVTIGNHDLFQDNSHGGWAGWNATFGPATYTVTVGSAIRFLFLDTSSGDVGPTQFSWLQTQLAQSKTSINIVGTHYPIYDGMTPLMWRLESPEERYKLTSLIDQLGVNYFIGGHIHGFKQNQVANVTHIIAGSMYPYALDYGNHGYVLFTYNAGALTWKWVPFPDIP